MQHWFRAHFTIKIYLIIHVYFAEQICLDVEYQLAGLPALQDSQPGQVRKEAATTVEQVPGVWLASFDLKNSKLNVGFINKTPMIF